MLSEGENDSFTWHESHPLRLTGSFVFGRTRNRYLLLLRTLIRGCMRANSFSSERETRVTRIKDSDEAVPWSLSDPSLR